MKWNPEKKSLAPKWNFDLNVMCSRCGEKPAMFKQVQLCAKCYQRTREKTEDEIPFVFGKNLEAKDLNIPLQLTSKYQHKAEIVFGQTHPDFIYQPAAFELCSTKYIPDFYDPNENVFYEIIGSRQRFQQLTKKIKKFRTLFPLIKLEIKCCNGNPYHSIKNPDLVSNGSKPISRGAYDQTGYSDAQSEPARSEAKATLEGS